MDKLLRNAIQSIEIGIEDYELSKHDERRIISCVRNVFAGILLLFKYKLVELSPENSNELLIKQKISWIFENGNIVAKGMGTKTVDVQLIKDRFKSLGILVNWGDLDEINQYRNNIEHYYDERTIEVVKEMIATAFPIINDFIRNELDRNPDELFCPSIWEMLLSISIVYEKERDSCLNNLKKLDFYHNEILNTISNHKCSNCGYGLINVEDGINSAAESRFYRCLSCKKQWNYKQLVSECLFEKYKDELWECGRCVGEEPIANCPSCWGEYDYIENICYSCEEGELNYTCQNCFSDIPANELASYPLCGYCDYKFEKLKEE